MFISYQLAFRYHTTSLTSLSFYNDGDFVYCSTRLGRHPELPNRQALPLKQQFNLCAIFLSTPIAIALGFYWGLIIFNLDRFFLLSANKKKNNNFIGQFKVILPRLALASILAVGITKPLELKIFESSINKEIATAGKAELQKEIETLRNDIKGLKSELKSKEKTRLELSNSANKPKIALIPSIQAEIHNINVLTKN